MISDDEVEEDEEEGKSELEMMGGQPDFLAYFNLIGVDAEELPRRNSLLERSLSPKKKKKKQVSRTRISQKDREREYSVPFSSPAGMVLTKKPLMEEDYILSRLEWIEDYCPARPTTKVSRTKMRFQQNNSEKSLMRQMRRIRPYYWPKRQLTSSTREQNFDFLNRWLIEDCKPLMISLKKLTNDDIKSYKERLIKIKEKKERHNCVDLISDSDSESVDLGDVSENDISEAMAKLNGQFLSFPIPSTTPSSTIFNPTSLTSAETLSTALSDFTKLSKVVSRTILSNGNIKINQNTSTSFEQSNPFTPADVSSVQRSCDGLELIEDLSDHHPNSIHEWLSNVSGENLQITI